MSIFALSAIVSVCIFFVVFGYVYKKRGKKGFSLPVYPLFAASAKDQVYFDETYPCSTLINLLDEVNKGADVKIISANFPKEEYGSDSKLHKWILEQLERNVKIKVIGGPEVEDRKNINMLVKKGMQVRISEKPLHQHCFLITSPVHFWVEREHDGNSAKDCYFTRKPRKNVWKKINTFFDDLFEESSEYNL